MIQQIYALIQEKRITHSVKELCTLYEVSCSGFYKWLKRNHQPNRYEQDQQVVDHWVQKIHCQYPTMGYRQIRDTLSLQTGWNLCDLTIWKSMKRLHIKGYVRKSRYPRNPGHEHPEIPNVLNRQFHAQRPLQKVVSDITYLKHKGKWFYLACFLDLFNNEIIEWELGNSLDNFLVLRPAKRLLERVKSKNLPILLHSDQGNQYRSEGYRSLLREYDAVQSFSRAGTPRDNAVIESFFGRFKDVLRFQYQYWKTDNLHQVMEETVHFFNFVRPVRKLNGKPPVQFRMEQVV